MSVKTTENVLIIFENDSLTSIDEIIKFAFITGVQFNSIPKELRSFFETGVVTEELAKLTGCDPVPKDAEDINTYDNYTQVRKWFWKEYVEGKWKDNVSNGTSMAFNDPKSVPTYVYIAFGMYTHLELPKDLKILDRDIAPSV
jgi:hypothetical protein